MNRGGGLASTSRGAGSSEMSEENSIILTETEFLHIPSKISDRYLTTSMEIGVDFLI